jgi:hypothetical protein
MRPWANQIECRRLIVREIFLRGTVIAILFLLFNCSCVSSAQTVWFDQRVTWDFGTEGTPWSTTIKNPNGPNEYQLELRPLWNVEGDVIAMEVVIARPQEPRANLLGKAENGVQYPFIITVHELEKGLAYSKFGSERTVQADDITLHIKIEKFRLGKSVGSGSIYCAKCKNLQQFSAQLTVKSKDK